MGDAGGCAEVAAETVMVEDRPQGAAVRSLRKAKGAGHLRRAEILTAAERLFVECGYEGATIRRIADDVGVSSTALYMHFLDKSEILAEICQGVFSELRAKDEALLARDMDPVARVRAMIEVYMAFGLEHPHAYQLVYSPSASVERDRQATLQDLGLKTFDVFRQAVAIAAEAGRLKPGDVDQHAQVAWAAGHGIISLRLSRPGFPWRPAEPLIQAVLDALFEGIAS